MLFNFFTLWLSILPFVTWGGRYEEPKVILFLVGGFLLVCFWLIRILVKKQNFGFTKPDIFYFLWLAVLLVSSLLGVHPFESVVGGSYRHQGLIFFLILWLLGKTIGILPTGEKKLFYKTVSLAILLEALIVIFQQIAGHVYFGKPLGTIGEANAVAGFLAIGSIFILAYLPVIFFLLPLTAAVFVKSRSGILSFMPSVVILFDGLNQKLKRFVWVLVIILMTVFIIFLSGSKGNSLFENRQTIWQLGIVKILEKPFLGYGAESGEVVYDKAFFENGFPLSNLIIDRSHNLFLDVVMWSGFAGLVLFCVWLALSFRRLKTPPQKLIVLSFLIYSMFQPLSIVHWILLFMIL